MNAIRPFQIIRSQHSDTAEVYYSGRWAIAFVTVAFALQLGLFCFGDSAVVRLPLRVGVYGASLGLLFVIPKRVWLPHPARAWYMAVVIVLAIGALNPNGDTLIARLAATSLYASVLAPLVWANRLRVSKRQFTVLIWLMWGFYAASAGVGALQVIYPGRFDGALSSALDDSSLMRHYIKIANGVTILRPRGLTDTPGGASNGGVSAIILGAGLLLTEKGIWRRGLLVSGMTIGLFSIYIGYVRVNLVIVGISLGIMVAILFWRGDKTRITLLLSVILSMATLGSIAALFIGGDAFINRFSTLVEDDVGTVYFNNRGSFLVEVFQKDIYDYPLGAGEGRCGLASTYFGVPEKNLYSEMLWQTLVFDGGIPLMLIYGGLFASLLTVTWRIVAGGTLDVSAKSWATMVLGYNVAAIAASFVFPIMVVQTGLELILLNACMFSVVQTERRRGGSQHKKSV